MPMALSRFVSLQKLTTFSKDTANFLAYKTGEVNSDCPIVF
jgi:hypothetical protein